VLTAVPPQDLKLRRIQDRAAPGQGLPRDSPAAFRRARGRPVSFRIHFLVNQILGRMTPGMRSFEIATLGLPG
jgi:hypothetical protein